MERSDTVKAILVIEMPSSCCKCDFQAMNVRDNPICILCTESCVEQFKSKDEYKRINTDLRTKPDWCPLRPAPEKRNTIDDFWEMCADIVRNACIDEILGDKE